MSQAQLTAARNRQRAARGSNAKWIDPSTLMRIKNLDLRAKVVVEGFYSGLHKSPFHGFSVEFSEYRQYTQGDDPRYIDWKLYARSDRHFIKRFEDETNLRCYLMVDRSRSMTYGPTEPTKNDYALTLAATIAFFLSLQRDAVGLMTFADRVIGYIPARYRPGHFRRMLSELEREPTGRTTNLNLPLERIAQLARRRGLIVLISDLLAPLEELDTKLSYLRSIGHDVIVLRVLDRTELDLGLEHPTMYVDAESGKRLYVDPRDARQSYRQKFDEHADAIALTCNRLGIDLQTLITDEPLESALFRFLFARGRRLSRSTRLHSVQQGVR